MSFAKRLEDEQDLDKQVYREVVAKIFDPKGLFLGLYQLTRLASHQPIV